jgi:hypothetical protein
LSKICVEIRVGVSFDVYKHSISLKEKWREKATRGRNIHMKERVASRSVISHSV